MVYNRFKNALLFSFIFVLTASIFWVFKFYNSKNDLNYDVVMTPVVNVITSSFIVSDVIKNIGGGRVNVFIVKNSDEFNLLESSNKNISTWFVLRGVEPWVDEICSKKNIKVVNLSNDVNFLDLDYKIEIGNLDSKIENYYWLSFEGIQNISVALARELSKIDQVGQEVYISNAFNYSRKLDSKKEEFESEYSKVKDKKFIAEGHYFDSFLNSFNLNTVGLFNLDSENREENLEDLEYNIVYFDINSIIISKQSNIKNLILDITHKYKVSVIELDTSGETGYNTYIDFMRQNFSIFLAGVRK